ncbi:EAL domain-containing protein [Rhodocyclaceae bacterium SMB388]
MNTHLQGLKDPSHNVRKFLDELPLHKQAGRHLRRLADGSVVGDWFGCELSSVFQPIVDSRTGNTVGHEAFLRCVGVGGQRDLSPWTLFSANADDERVVALDRLARTIHALNVISSLPDDGLLFLNVHGRLLATVTSDHGAAFRRVVDALGLPPERIVIETPLAASEQVDLLAFVLRNYRQNGFRVAVNVESEAQWRALSTTVLAQYIKIDGAKLIANDGAQQELARLAEQSSHAQIIVTRLDAPLEVDRSIGNVWLQGYAYGLPEQHAALAPPTRLILNRFAW